MEAAVQAPSADNRHLFLFDQAGDAARIWACDQFMDAPFQRRVLSLISLGAIIENMVLRGGVLGFDATVQWSPAAAEPQLLAELTLNPRRTTTEELAAAIPARHTNRRFFQGPRMSATERRQIEAEGALVAGIRLIWLDGALRGDALRLIRVAESERFRCKELHQELFSCIRFDVGWNSTAEEGLAPGSLEIEWPVRPAFKALRHWSFMRWLAKLGVHHMLALRAAEAPCRFSPHLGVIATTLELEAGAPAVGRALERIWLRATSLGMALQPLAASTLLALPGYTQIRPQVRKRLAQGWASITGEMKPLMVFRLGRAAPASVRNGRLPLSSYLR